MPLEMPASLLVRRHRYEHAYEHERDDKHSGKVRLLITSLPP